VRESVICLIGTMEVIAKEIRKLMTKLTRKTLRVNLPELIVPISDRRKLMESPIMIPIFLPTAFMFTVLTAFLLFDLILIYPAYISI